MGTALKRVAAIQEALGCTVVLVHHTGKDAERGARGSSSLKAAVDTEIEIKAKGAFKEVTATKQREIEGGSSLYYELLAVELGTNDDGDPITTCRVEFAEAECRTTPKGKNQQAVLDHLLEFWAERQRIDGVEGRAEEREVTRSDFTDYALEKWPVDDRKGAKRAIKDAIEGLAKNGSIGISEDKLWLTG